MSDTLKIFVDRLNDGSSSKWESNLEPIFLGPNEKELQFNKPVHVKGEAYITDKHLVLHLHAETKIEMPCAICNNMIEIEIKVHNYYHAEPLEDIKSAIFDSQEVLREAVLLELPKKVECKGGNCPERGILSAYLRSPKKEEKEDIYFPFSDIDQIDKENS